MKSWGYLIWLNLKEGKKSLVIGVTSWRAMVLCSIRLWSILVWLVSSKVVILLYNHHFSWRVQLCMKHANWVILMKTYTKLKALMIRILFTWLPPQSNQFLRCIEMSGLNQQTYHLDTQEILLVSVKKLGLMEKMFGEFSESINLKRWNNLFLLLLINHGKN